MNRLFTPFTLPIYAFGTAVLAGTLLLLLDGCRNGMELYWIDALFTATSAVCVTGLTVVDTAATFNRNGQTVILLLMQLGGLGIMTYSSLVFFLWRRRISLSDRLAVGRALLHDPSFHLGSFLLRMAGVTILLELVGAVLLNAFDSQAFPPFSALFHAVSAFCNAGFSLFSDSLSGWRYIPELNLIFILLIFLGGIGFSVIDETVGRVTGRTRQLSRHSRLVISTSLMLVFGGAAAIFLGEVYGGRTAGPSGMLAALFQSVTCRTAGFNTLNIGTMTNLSLLVMIFLMFIGGSPGSCAGGIKTTTFRSLLAFVRAQLRGRKQVSINGRALDTQTINKALTLFTFEVLVVVAATVILTATEGGDIPHPEARGQFLETLFEVISAFATVGLTTGVTPTLSPAGKLVITTLMFVGRIGPIWILTALQSVQREPKYRLPEIDLPIG